MLVPRAFGYRSIQEKHVEEVYEEKPKRPPLARADGLSSRSKSSDPGPGLGPVPTKPVGIPQRGLDISQDSARIRSNRMQHSGQSASRPTRGHDPAGIPPSVAALLAMTNIPPPKPHQISRNRKNSTPKNLSIDELIQDWRTDEISPSLSLGGDSPLSILLQSPEEGDTDGAGTPDYNDQEQDSTTCRSTSSDSVPSLSVDGVSLISSSNPSTSDGVRSARSFDRKVKSFSSPESQSCELDHPLLHPPLSHDDDETYLSKSTSIPSLPTFRRPSPPSITSTFKSNLTASILAFKSAAKSFSNFTAPSIPSDDLLTRSIIFPRFTPEMRPKPVDGVPEPAFRRYLNPGIAEPVYTRPYHSHDRAILYDAQKLSLDHGDEVALMIPMQPYRNGRIVPSTRGHGAAPTTTIPKTLSGGRDLLPEANHMVLRPAVRQREPRENSDFLRIIVLEMNMRRVGKFDVKKPGRAKIWLPPRQVIEHVDEDKEAEEEWNESEKVAEPSPRIPARWVGIRA